MHHAARPVRGVDGGSPPRTSHAKYVGRVGALAVFLGVGAAIAMPTAHADTGGSAPSSGSSSHSTSAKKSGSSSGQRAQGMSARVAVSSASSTVTAVHRTVGSADRGGPTGTPAASPADLAAVAYLRRRPA
ncbi:MAG: hypothetical protein HY239_19010, partial [Mycolicibacterium aromaticivorans]|nr:hypothetical protein [Mycolicibacterium aromaticivorans]